jgi:predicted nucleotidyltransferase
MINGDMTTDRPNQPGHAADRAVAMAFLEKLRGTYDVARAIMFGSRARGDHGPDSDLDLAVILNGGRGDLIDVKLDMAGIAFDVLLETGVLVQAFPIWDDDLAYPERFANPALIDHIVSDGIKLR